MSTRVSRTFARAVPLFVVAVVLVLFVAACAPGAGPVGVAPPELRVVPGATRLVALDPPGIGRGVATVRIPLDVVNPNPVGIELRELVGDLELGGTRAGAARFAGGLAIPARGTTRLDLDVDVRISEVPEVLSGLVGLVSGRSLSYALSARATVDVLGFAAPLPRTTLLSGEVPPIQLALPRLALNGDASGLRDVGLLDATLVVRLSIENPGPVGYRVQTPSLEFVLGSATVASSRLEPVEIPAFTSRDVALEVHFRPLELGAALVDLVQRLADGTASATLVVRGGLQVDAPGLARASVDPGTLVEGLIASP